MSGLTAFQDAFTDALAGDDAALSPWLERPGPHPGLTVYRNTSAKGLADALAAAFPAVQRIVGEGWFEAAAIAFARERPPTEPSLLAYGPGFAAWLAAFGPAQSMPYLAGVARLDRMWLEAHLAADAPVLEASDFADLGAGDLEALTVRVHPSVRFAWFDDTTPSLWRAHLPDAPALDAFALEDRGEGVLIARPHGAVTIHILDSGGHAFVAACAAGRSLADAADDALKTDPAADLPAIVQTCLAAGTFTGLMSVERLP